MKWMPVIRKRAQRAALESLNGARIDLVTMEGTTLVSLRFPDPAFDESGVLRPILGPTKALTNGRAFAAHVFDTGNTKVAEGAVGLPGERDADGDPVMVEMEDTLIVIGGKISVKSLRTAPLRS